MTLLREHKKYAETIQEIVSNQNYLKFTPEESIPVVIERMHNHGSGAGVVIDNSSRFLGLITEREIIRKLYGNIKRLQTRLHHLSDLKASKHITAFDLMIPDPDTLHPSDSVEDALDVITYYGYRFMPVVRGRNRVTGIIDARELFVHAQAKAKDEIKSKDNLLSYFMYPEPYGGAGGYETSR